MANRTPYLGLVGDNPVSQAIRPRHESPELARIRDAIFDTDANPKSAEKLATSGMSMVRAAMVRRPSKSIESVGAWLSDHMDAVRLREDPYPRIHDLKEAVLAAADELDSASGRNGAAWRHTYDVVIGQLDPNAPKVSLEINNATSWLTRASAIPNYVWIMTAIGLFGIFLGYTFSKGRR